jgi:hypothetical protein
MADAPPAAAATAAATAAAAAPTFASLVAPGASVEVAESHAPNFVPADPVCFGDFCFILIIHVANLCYVAFLVL